MKNSSNSSHPSNHLTDITNSYSEYNTKYPPQPPTSTYADYSSKYSKNASIYPTNATHNRHSYQNTKSKTQSSEYDDKNYPKTYEKIDELRKWYSRQDF